MEASQDKEMTNADLASLLADPRARAAALAAAGGGKANEPAAGDPCASILPIIPGIPPTGGDDDDARADDDDFNKLCGGPDRGPK
jgi:hypothetical protein